MNLVIKSPQKNLITNLKYFLNLLNMHLSLPVVETDRCFGCFRRHLHCWSGTLEYDTTYEFYKRLSNSKAGW